MQIEGIDVTIKVDIGPGNHSHSIISVRLEDTLDGWPVSLTCNYHATVASNNIDEVMQVVEAHPILQLRLCESPVEVRFFLAAIEALPNIQPQVEVSPYRTDFALANRRIAIEIDGHEYHKTPEQRTRDAQRERYLQLSGWRVIRFTGSEVYKNVWQCVEEVVQLVNSFDNTN